MTVEHLSISSQAARPTGLQSAVCPPHDLITDNKVVYSQRRAGSVQEGEQGKVSLLADRDSSYSLRSGPVLSPFTSSPEHRGLS